MIEMRKLRELVKLMKENDLCELDIRDEQEHVKLKRPQAEPMPIVTAQPMAAPPNPGVVPAAAPPAGNAPAAVEDRSGLVEITSPMVGTFYSAASPDAEPFVRVGSEVDDEAVVCIIEAMKVFNEIKAEARGVIEKVLVGSGQAVEFGQPLFLIRPAAA